MIEVNFEPIPDPKRRKEFLEIPTSVTLTPEQVDRLIRIGPELLRAEPNFKEFMESLKTPKPGRVAAGSADICWHGDAL